MKEKVDHEARVKKTIARYKENLKKYNKQFYEANNNKVYLNIKKTMSLEYP
ncbi:MAG: hypothetical protein RCG15_01940 [Candidatus Rickettsia vulgarisii]